VCVIRNYFVPIAAGRIGHITNNPFSRHDRCFVFIEKRDQLRAVTANYVVTNFPSLSTITRTLHPNIEARQTQLQSGGKKAQSVELNGNIISFRIADEWKPENGHGGKLPNSHQTKFHCSIANTIFFSILTHYVMKLRLVNREYIIKTNVEKIE